MSSGRGWACSTVEELSVTSLYATPTQVNPEALARADRYLQARPAALSQLPQLSVQLQAWPAPAKAGPVVKWVNYDTYCHVSIYRESLRTSNSGTFCGFQEGALEHRPLVSCCASPVGCLQGAHTRL